MLHLVLSVIACAYGLSPLVAHAGEAKADCYDKAQTQFELNSCASDEYAAADKELNQVYQGVLERYKGDAKFIVKLREAQRAWLRYRDAEFEAKFPHHQEVDYLEYGNVFPMCANVYRVQLIRERITKLREWLDGTDEGNACAGSVDRSHPPR